MIYLRPPTILIPAESMYRAGMAPRLHFVQFARAFLQRSREIRYDPLNESRRWKQKRTLADAFCLAGREGFEPSVDTRPTTVFETVPFNHSGTSPELSRARYWTVT